MIFKQAEDHAQVVIKYFVEIINTKRATGFPFDIFYEVISRINQWLRNV